MKKNFALLPLIFLLLSGTGHRTTETNRDKVSIGNKRPNIVIIMADDLDSKQLSCYGGKNLVTKHIDDLAKQGLQFSNMICSEAMCVPTRASLFTGLYPMKHGSFQNHKQVYNDSIQSVCHYLRKLGYEVALTGKDHSTKPVTVFPFKIINGFEPNCVASTDNYSLNDIRSFITSQKEQPFCLFIMSINPHTPWTMGDPAEFDTEKLVLPPHWVDSKQVRNQFAKYLAEIRRLDNQVGEIQTLINETGKEKETIFIFLGEQGAQFPGAKWNLWEQGQLSSMIVKWPGVIKPNTQSNAITQYEDITPTLIDIAGGKPIAGVDGKSFLPVLKSPHKPHREFAYGIHNNIPEGDAYPMRSIRSEQFKLIYNLTPAKNYYNKFMMNPDNKGSYWNGWLKIAETDTRAKELTERIINRPEFEFYDLKKDPFELNNLANDPEYKKQKDAYLLQLKKWMKEQGDKGAGMDIDYKASAKGE